MYFLHLRPLNAHSVSSLAFRQSLVACDPVDVRNARNAVIEALPQMLSSMALLWGVVMREEFQRRASDSGQSSRHTSTSVYFRTTKVCICCVTHGACAYFEDFILVLFYKGQAGKIGNSRKLFCAALSFILGVGTMSTVDCIIAVRALSLMLHVLLKKS